MNKITLREINAIPTLMHWRAEVIENVFGEKPSKRVLVANRRYYRDHIAEGSHIAVVAEIDEIGVGCGAISLSEELPSPDNPSGRCGYLMNIYVRKEYRSQGIGRFIVRWLVEKAMENGCGKIWLETTGDARPLYRSIGFKDQPDIMKYADLHDSES